MKYRSLGKSGMQVSELGFGCWPIGGGWKDQDDARDIRALHNALNKGVNFYDTAMGYGAGHSEEVLGEAFCDKRDQVLIATKIGPKAKPVLSADEVYPYDWIIECTENSLRRLKTDYIDVQQIHCWRDHFTEAPGWLEAMLKLKEQGKIRSIGVSAEDWEWNGAVRIAESGHIDSIQCIYNVFDQQPQERLFPTVLEHEVGIIVRVPLLEGLLGGNIRPGHQFIAGDWREKFLTPERIAEAQPHLEALGKCCYADAPTLAALSLKFILRHPAVSTVIVGMTKSHHVDENCATAETPPLSDELWEELKQQAWLHGWDYPWNSQA